MSTLLNSKIKYDYKSITKYKFPPNRSHIYNYKSLGNQYVYQPDSDSLILIDAVTHDLQSSPQSPSPSSTRNLLEVGVGSGVVITTLCNNLNQSFSLQTGIDINPVAVECALQTMNSNTDEEMKNKVRLFCSPFSEVDFDMYDVVIFNPPQVPSSDGQDELQKQTQNGGEDGNQIIDMFVDCVTGGCRRGQVVQIVLTQQNCPGKLVEEWEGRFAKVEVLVKNEILGETLQVVKLQCF